MMSSTSLPSPRLRLAQRRKSIQVATSTIDPRAVLACELDRNADALLFWGCHVAAERLAVRAQALRDAGR